MKTYRYTDLNQDQLEALCARGGSDLSAQRGELDAMRTRIICEGDAALREYSSRFDGADIDQFLMTSDELSRLSENIDPILKTAIQIAAANIENFHRSEIRHSEPIETSTGVLCWREYRAIESVGLYVPGGTAPLFSTLLMTAIPAKIAGCDKIVVCTPPQRDGMIAPEIAYTAQLLGISCVHRLGGAQAIFAMAHGTETIPKVDKIFGPGNGYVTGAKMLVSNQVAIDMPAGPSEVLIIADQTANPAFIASDLLAQAEHGPDSRVILCANDTIFTKSVAGEIEQQLPSLTRTDIARHALDHSMIMVTDSMAQAFEFSNLYAPEHLILSFEEFHQWIPMIKNAGSVFCGPLSCESFGDYASGPNHVLPTAGFARGFSGVSVDSFQKVICFQQISKTGCRTLGPVVETLARAEGLDAHKNAVSIRLDTIGRA